MLRRRPGADSTRRAVESRGGTGDAPRRSEQAESIEQALGGGDDRLGVADSLGGFVGVGVVTRSLGVLQLVAASAQRAELSEPRTELRSGGLLDGVVATLGRRPQALR
ncbi:hypothetical protein [Nocardioides hungaricus]